MRIAVIILLLGSVSFAGERGPLTEDAAIAIVKRTTASQLDIDLPQRAFGAWIGDTFKDWSVRWESVSCGEAAKTAAHESKSEKKRGPASCVQVDIMQPPQQAGGRASRGYHVLFQVSDDKSIPRFRSAIRQEDDQEENVDRLSEVEP